MLQISNLQNLGVKVSLHLSADHDHAMGDDSLRPNAAWWL